MVTRVKRLIKHTVKNRIDNTRLNKIKSKPAASRRPIGNKDDLSLRKKVAADKKPNVKTVKKQAVSPQKAVSVRAKLPLRFRKIAVKKIHPFKSKTLVVWPKIRPENKKITPKGKKITPEGKMKERTDGQKLVRKTATASKAKIKIPVKKVLPKIPGKNPRQQLKKVPVLKKPEIRKKLANIHQEAKFAKVKRAKVIISKVKVDIVRVAKVKVSKSKPSAVKTRMPKLVTRKTAAVKAEPKPEVIPVIHEPEKKHVDYWSSCGQLFTAGKAYGLTNYGQTICVGARSAVQEFLEGGNLGRDLNKYQQEVLIRIKEQQAVASVQAQPEPPKTAKRPVLAPIRRTRTR